MTLTAILGFLLLFAGFLFLFQRKMIYFPQRYEAAYVRGLPSETAEIQYQTSQGNQIAFYLPPREEETNPPGSLWVLFHGNAATALDWLDLVESVPDDHAAFLLIDYPGYGKCEGSPSRASIRETTEAVFEALARQLLLQPSELEKNLNVLAFSIGTGAGLEFAAAHPVRRVILLAPFTDLLSMARRSVGWPLCYLLLDRFDNRTRLVELSQQSITPEVHIFHGTADDIIPFRMGETLAREFPTLVTFHPVPNVDHNFLPAAVEPQLADLIAKETP